MELKRVRFRSWHPGSFTKNINWRITDRGLKDLFDGIRIGFDNKLQDTPRAQFRNRVIGSGKPDYIPLNFFLFNRIKAGIDFVVVAELVFQAVSFRHSAAFDKLALFAFNLSRVGRWNKAAPYQDRSDRKSVASGQRVSVRVDLVGRRII